MTDYSELKRLAEALHGAEWQLVDGDGFDADNRFVTSQRRIDDNKVAFAEINYGHPEAGMGEPFQSEQVTAGEFIAAANPAAVLALIAENERLKKFEDWFGRLETANNSLVESFRAERDQIKAENEALRDDLEQAQYDAGAWRNPEESVWIQVFLGEGDDPFISAVHGAICIEQVALIQGEILENSEDYFEQGPGFYVFECRHREAHYDNVGMTEPAHWEIDFSEYARFPWADEQDAERAAMSKGEQV